MFHMGSFKCVLLVLESNKMLSMCIVIVDFKFLTVTISLSHKKADFTLFYIWEILFYIKELKVFKIYTLLLYCKYSEGSRCGKAVGKMFNLKMQSIDQLIMSLGKSWAKRVEESFPISVGKLTGVFWGIRILEFLSDA